jgi:predicted nuclease of restriction endonuclease-like (RecB) superfamily
MAKRKNQAPALPARRSPPTVVKVVARTVGSAAPAKPGERPPKGYASLLADVKARVRAAQVKASLAVNRELIELYWDVGRAIVIRQRSHGWGNKVVDRLATDLQREFPGVGGLSRGNVYRMRGFFLAYAGEAIVAQPARQSARRAAGGRRKSKSAAIVAQAARQLDAAVLPPAVAAIPWGHNIVLVDRLKAWAERLWYAEQTTANGWSRAVLEHQIDTGLFHRAGRAVNNFAATMPAADSDLARQLLKDPYNFDFLSLAADAKERDLQQGLVGRVRQFLLELGVGFAFVGENVRVEIGGDDFFLDLLFYHLRLRRYVVIDLKVEAFRPEFAGKMNFYLSAVDDLMRHADDQPSIGLILCRAHDRVVAEYALRDAGKPMGVATYAATLPPALRDSLPSPDTLARALSRAPSRRPRPRRRTAAPS